VLTLVQLQCFVAVAEELHFGAAARRLQMTQPPVSRQIQLLERELGSTLLLRTSRRVSLTAAGEALLPRAQRILSSVTQTAVDVRRTASGVIGSLTIGYMATVAQSALPVLLGVIVESLPDVSVTLREMVSTDQLDDLGKGNVDLGLVRPMVYPAGIVSRPIMTERLVAAVPADGPLGQHRGPLPLADLDGHPFVMYSHGYFREVVRQLFVAAGTEPQVTQYAHQVSAILAFVQAGMGAALVPGSARHYALDNVVVRELVTPGVPSEMSTITVCVAWREDGINPVVTRVLELVGEPA